MSGPHESFSRKSAVESSDQIAAGLPSACLIEVVCLDEWKIRVIREILG